MLKKKLTVWPIRLIPLGSGQSRFSIVIQGSCHIGICICFLDKDGVHSSLLEDIDRFDGEVAYRHLCVM